MECSASSHAAVLGETLFESERGGLAPFLKEIAINVAFLSDQEIFVHQHVAQSSQAVIHQYQNVREDYDTDDINMMLRDRRLGSVESANQWYDE